MLSCEQESGKWQVASGKWKVASGKWQVESGKWQVESGKWQVASGKWQVTSDKWNVKPDALCVLLELPNNSPNARDHANAMLEVQAVWHARLVFDFKPKCSRSSNLEIRSYTHLKRFSHG